MAEYIEREAAIAAAFSATSLGNSAFRDVYDTVSRLRLIPAADVRPVVRGQWVDGKCNQCGEHAPFWSMATTYYRSRYCPNCGADMRPTSMSGAKEES